MTKKSTNPKWTKDESILILDLYFETRPKLPFKSDPRVVELSQLMSRLPYHTEDVRNGTFRNPNGIAMKLQNLRYLAIGKGLAGASRMDKLVWEEFGTAPEEVRRIAKTIRHILASSSANSQTHEEEDIEFREGKILFRWHKYRERHPSLKKLLIASFQKRCEPIICAVCGICKPSHSEEAGLSIFEAHHVLGLANAGETHTKISDLALLCANCHRLIHRISALRGKWYSVADLKREIRIEIRK